MEKVCRSKDRTCLDKDCCISYKESGINPVVSAERPAKPRPVNQIPPDVLEDAELNEAIAALPNNYNFEVHKSVWQLRKYGAKRVGLQFPEGLLLFSTVLADIFQRHCQVQVILMGDVTYGACCIDDFTAELLGCDFIIHYGHSCLVPIGTTSSKIRILYVFVEVTVEAVHLVDLLRLHFKQEQPIALMGTVQFIGVLHHVKRLLADWSNLYIPQIRPLSPGEVLGCTAPRLPASIEALVFVADGRFHLEAAMIANPAVPAYRYDPYQKMLTKETYDHSLMQRVRREAIERARCAKVFGLVLSTIGRQGSPAILHDIQKKLQARGLEGVVVLLSEIRPEKLALFEGVDAWVQVGCPRLSIDWGSGFGDKPLLSPYELNVMLGEAAPFWDASYPMDFYASDGAGPWTVNYHRQHIK